MEAASPNFRLYANVPPIQTVCDWEEAKRIDGQNPIQRPEIDLRLYAHVSFDKGTKKIK